jgi:hypothetical protein
MKLRMSSSEKDGKAAERSGERGPAQSKSALLPDADNATNCASEVMKEEGSSKRALASAETASRAAVSS